MTLKEIMIKDLQTYTCVHLADLQAFHTRQMKNLVAKCSHYYVIGKLNIFFFLQDFLPWKCKLGLELQLQCLWSPKFFQVAKICSCKMCLINVLKYVSLFFSFASHAFWRTSTTFPNNIKFTISPLSHSPFLIYFLITLLILGLMLPWLTKDWVWVVEKCHIKSIKDIRSITVTFMLRHLRMSSDLKF